MSATSDADQSKYLIHSRLEIAAILNTLCTKGTMITAYFSGGHDFILTSVAAVDPEQDLVCVDYGADDEANQRALKARKISFAAEHQRIKIQFSAESLQPARVGGRGVFSMGIPKTLLRMQRREYFRITTPLTKPLKCMIPPRPGAVDVATEATIVDISCGGIALIDSIEPAGIEFGAILRGCRILLPGLGEVSTGIAIKSTFEVAYRSGAKHKRAGCEFVDMRERDRALIQRFISRLEHERKDRAGTP